METNRLGVRWWRAS